MTETKLPPPSTSTRRLLRSRSDRKFAGVCGGLASYFDVDANAIRLGAVLATLFSAGTVLLAYLAGALLIPEE